MRIGHKIGIVCSAAVICISTCASGQTKHIETGTAFWTAATINAKLPHKLLLTADYQYRRTGDFDLLTQTSYRAGLGAHLAENLTAIAGLAYMNYYPTFESVSGAIWTNVTRHEYRAWEQISISGKVGGLPLQHRYRAEHRWTPYQKGNVLADSFRFNHRVRYRVSTELPLITRMDTAGHKSTKLKLVLSDEVMVNLGKQIAVNVFDQNRIIAGLAAPLGRGVQLQVSYLNLYAQKRSISTTITSGTNGKPVVNAAVGFEVSHAYQIFLTKELDFSKPAPKK